MRRIKDAPELKAEFEKAYAQCDVKFEHPIEKNFAEHFFMVGRDSVKPKRTIAEVHRMGDSFFVISNDGKMFHWQGNQMGWYALPDLPQEG